MNRELVLWLLQQHYQPKHLHPRPSSQEETLILGINEAIELRDNGNATLGLALLQQLQQLGFTHPWLAFHQAQCLIQLGQVQQAVSILEPLAQLDDGEIAPAATNALAQLNQALLKAIREECTSQGWACQHLPQDLVPGDGDFLLAVLNEAIAIREANRAELSLSLINIALQQGWSNPWLLDNQARAFVHQGRRDEACDIWEQLQHHGDQAAATEARRMLGSYQPHRISHPLRDAVVSLEQTGQREEAERILLEGLSSAPDDPELWKLLESFQTTAETPNELLSMELGPRERRLAAEERLIAHFESILGTGV